MRATFNKLIYILPLVLVFFSLDLIGQTQEQLDEIKAFERKIEMNKDNPNFNAEAAMKELKGMKERYGIKAESLKHEKVGESGKPTGNSTSKPAPIGVSNHNVDSQQKATASFSLKLSEAERAEKIEYLEKSIKRCEEALSEIASGKVHVSEEFRKSVEDRLQADKEYLNRIK